MTTTHDPRSADVATAEAIGALLVRADDALKTLATRRQAGPARERVAAALDEARDLLDEVVDDQVRRDLAARITRRVGDLDLASVAELLGPTPGVSRAPTKGIDATRIPPNQHLTAGWPVLHVGSTPPDTDPATWRLTVTGLVERRTVLTVPELADQLPVVRTRADFHCVTGWTRLDNDWEGVRAADLLDLAGVRPEATHVIASGHPAYSAEVDLDVVRGAEVALYGSHEVLVAWSHDGRPLDVAHGGPLRLVVPTRYGWKSVKWLTELRLTDRDVPGYWEERGYHAIGEPFAEQRYRAVD